MAPGLRRLTSCQDGVGDVRDVLPGTLGQAEEVGEFAGQLCGEPFRRGGDVDDGNAVLCGALADEKAPAGG